MDKRLKRTTPSEAGVSAAAVSRMLDLWSERGCEIHSFMLLRHGMVAAEGWWKPYAPEYTHMLYSLSKSFTSAGAVFAVREGYFGYDDTVASFFPEYAPRCVNMRMMKVRHLLSMCTGHSPNADFIFGEADPVKAFIESDVPREPGSFFSYNTGATFMVSAIITKTTGLRLIDFLRPRLLDPLGIEGVSWDGKNGIDFGGFGFNVHTEDIARFGQMLLAGGEYAGERIFTPEEVHEMTTRRINNWSGTAHPCLDDAVADDLPEDARNNDWCQGYGRQFWRCVPEGVYRGDGMYGQYCIVMPKQDAVMAITSGVSNMQAVLDGIWTGLLPRIDDPSAPEDDAALAARCAALELTYSKGRGSAASGEAVFVDAQGASATLRYGADGETLSLSPGDDDRLSAVRVLRGWSEADKSAYTVAAGGFTSDSVFEAKLYYVTTPYSSHVKLDLASGTGVIMHYPDGESYELKRK